MPKGFKHTEETKRKMSEVRRGKNNPNYGKKHTEESLQKMRDKATRRGHTEETRRKMSEARCGENNVMHGRKHTETSKKLMSKNRKGKNTGPDNHNYGKPQSEETRKKISESMTGKYKGKNSPNYGVPKSAEHRKKLSEAAKKRPPISDETRKKMGDSRRGPKNHNYGKTPSAERRRKQSKALKGRFAGEKNPSWKGGVSFEPYGPEFNDVLKRKIRDRDNHTCQWCSDSGKYVHHIDGEHKNNEAWNLITLCLSCNAKEQYHRKEMKPIFYEKNRKYYNILFKK